MGNGPVVIWGPFLHHLAQSKSDRRSPEALREPCWCLQLPLLAHGLSHHRHLTAFSPKGFSTHIAAATEPINSQPLLPQVKKNNKLLKTALDSFKNQVIPILDTH